jgi:hypothetical protein
LSASSRIAPWSVWGLRDLDDLAGEDQIESARVGLDLGVRVLYALKADIEPIGDGDQGVPGWATYSTIWFLWCLAAAITSRRFS